jgi:leucyl aminopeptidase
LAAAAPSAESVPTKAIARASSEITKSPIADILNSNANRKAHPIQGAAFLSYFVEDNVPWCHLDIAGVHVSESNKGMFVDGPTGWGVRLLAEMMEG